MRNLFRESFVFKESQCSIVCDKKAGIEVAKEEIKLQRDQLERYISDHPKFGWTLKPIPIPDAPLVAKLMATAAEKANVGPMAAVAGVLADLAVRAMLSRGCSVAVVEDGGEIAAISNEPIDIAVAAGNEPLSRRFGFRLTSFPIGVATSSGRFSHALSFGDAEAAIVFSSEAGLADAVATATCNAVKGENTDEAIANGIKVAKSVNGVDGALILYKGCIGTWGKIPQIIRVDPDATK